MKAKIRPRINLKDRTRLETVIPLSTPYLVFLDPSDKCNFQCRFCPTGNRKLIRSFRRPRFMNLTLYRKIIDDLCDMPDKIKTLRLYADGEPTMNSHLPDMIKYAKQADQFLQIDFTTNASLLDVNKNLQLIDAGLDKIFISINGMNNNDYWQFCRTRLQFGRIVNAIRHFYKHRSNCKVHIKLSGDHLSEKKKSLFFETFGNIADYVSIEHTANCWPGFEVEGVNKELGIYGQVLQQVNICAYCFYSLKINSDGTVSICFLDYKHHMIIGDLNVESFKNIWNGERLRTFQIDMLNGRSKIPFCADCGQLRYGFADNIDKFASNIRRRLVG